MPRCRDQVRIAFGLYPLSSRTWAGRTQGRPGPIRGTRIAIHHGGELVAVVGVSTRDREGEWSTERIADQVNLAGQAAPRASERRLPDPPFGPRQRAGGRAQRWSRPRPAKSMSLAASAFAFAAWSIRSKAPSLAQRRKRVWSVAHTPYRSGTSRQATPVRNFRTIPLRTTRLSNRFRAPAKRRAAAGGRTPSPHRAVHGDVSPDHDPLSKII